MSLQITIDLPEDVLPIFPHHTGRLQRIFLHHHGDGKRPSIAL
jgi:hypothetical protein